MKITIKNSKITVAGKTVLDNRCKNNIVLDSVVCILCESIKDCGEIINKPISCGQCGYTHKK